MSLFSVDNCLRIVKESVVDVAEVLGYSSEDIEKIENQWRNITIVKWSETESTEKFWFEVHRYTDASGVNPFQEVTELAVSILSLPHSNVEVERLFSQLNIVKSKLRNRLNTESVNALLAVRSGLKRVEKCCSSYNLPKSVVNLIGTMAAYQSQHQETSLPRASTSTSAAVKSDDNDEDDIFLLLDN